MNTQSELEVWRSAWKTSEPAPAAAPTFDLRARHRRQENRLRLVYFLNLVVAAVLIWFAAFILSRNFRPEILAWAIVVWLTTLGVTAFQVWNWRSLWDAAGRSVLDYTNIFERRCLASLRAVRFGYLFLVLQLSITVSWLTWDFFRHAFSSGRYAFAMSQLALFTVAYIVSFRISRRRALSDLNQLKAFRNSLGLDDES